MTGWFGKGAAAWEPAVAGMAQQRQAAEQYERWRQQQAGGFAFDVRHGNCDGCGAPYVAHAMQDASARRVCRYCGRER